MASRTCVATLDAGAAVVTGVADDAGGAAVCEFVGVVAVVGVASGTVGEAGGGIAADTGVALIAAATGGVGVGAGVGVVTDTGTVADTAGAVAGVDTGGKGCAAGSGGISADAIATGAAFGGAD